MQFRLVINAESVIMTVELILVTANHLLLTVELLRVTLELPPITVKSVVTNYHFNRYNCLISVINIHMLVTN